MPRQVLLLSGGQDLAGVNYRIKVAFDKFSKKYSCRQAVSSETYIEYPKDILWMGRNSEVNAIYDKADLVHITENPNTLTQSTPKIWSPVPKPTVLHQHGTTFRSNPATYLAIAKANRWTQIVSTIDLTINDEVEWVPNPVDIPMMAKIRERWYEDTGGIRLMHAPTNRTEKHTAIFVANGIRMAAEDDTTKWEVVENQSWEYALGRKATADIWYDQLTYGYGNNGIEAMAMGIPVIGGFADKKNYAKLGDIPFFPADRDTLGDVMRLLAASPAMRSEYSAKGMAYVYKHHDEEVVVRKLEAIYDRTIGDFNAA